LPKNAYRTGYLAENETVQILIKAGFKARREFRSGNNWFGKFHPRGDVIATHPKVGFIFIEVKRLSQKNCHVVRIPSSEGSKLREWAEFFSFALNSKTDSRLLFVVRFPQKKWWIKEISLVKPPERTIIAREEDAKKNGLFEYAKSLVENST